MRRPHGRQVRVVLLGLALSAVAAVRAEEPLPPGANRAVEATAGNDLLQLYYYIPGPMNNIGNDWVFGALVTPNRELVASTALLFETDLHLIPRFTFELGPKVYLGWLQNTSTNSNNKNDVFSLAIGGAVRYEVIRSLGFSVWGSAFYAPNVLTFGAANNVYDFNAGAEVRILPQLQVLGGYRWLKFSLSNGPGERVGNEVFAGLRWQFK
jgi:hypothetical protein